MTNSQMNSCAHRIRQVLLALFSLYTHVTLVMIQPLKGGHQYKTQKHMGSGEVRNVPHLKCVDTIYDVAKLFVPLNDCCQYRTEQVRNLISIKRGMKMPREVSNRIFPADNGEVSPLIFKLIHHKSFVI